MRFAAIYARGRLCRDARGRSTAVPPIQEGEMASGIDLIAAERERQVSVEGWTPEHDDEHGVGEMTWAAVCYAAPNPVKALLPRQCNCRSVGECGHAFPVKVYRDPWPWDAKWDKRGKHDRIRQLAIAGALIAAEIDRLQRAAIKEDAA